VSGGVAAGPVFSVFLPTTWWLQPKLPMMLRGLLVGLLRRSEIRSPNSVEHFSSSTVVVVALVVAVVNVSSDLEASS